VAPPPGESPVHLECRSSACSIGRSSLSLDELWSGEDIDIARLKPLGRLGRSLYAPIIETRELPRPEIDPPTGRLRRLEP
jgi:hypothetical protein